MRLLAAFCVLAACASGFAAATLAWPGTAIDAAWQVNPDGHEGLRSLGAGAIVGMTALSATAAFAAYGVLTLHRWAWWLVVAGIGINATSDLLTAIVTGKPATLIGVPIAGAILWWLTRPVVRARFR